MKKRFAVLLPARCRSNPLFPLFLFLAVQASHAQITWTKAWLTPHTGNSVGVYINGYEEILYDPFSAKTYLYTTRISQSDPTGIYSSRLHFFDSSAPINTGDTQIADNGQPVTGTTTCQPSNDSGNQFPYTHHAVGMVAIDTKRHRFVEIGGVCGTFQIPEMWYYQLTSPPDLHPQWVELFPPHMLMFNSQDTTHFGNPTATLTAALGPSDTQMSVSNPSVYLNHLFVKLDSEIILITAGGGKLSSVPGANPFTIARAQYGTTAASHNIGTSAFVQESPLNSSTLQYDADNDAYILFGAGSGTGVGAYANVSLWAYCPTDGNPVPGTLTANQVAVGCTQSGGVDDWTEITKYSQCTDSNCVGGNRGTGGSGNGMLPKNFYYPNLSQDTVRHQFIMFGGGYGIAPQNSTWTAKWDNSSPIRSFVWTNMNPACVGNDCVAGNPMASAPLPQSDNTEGFMIFHAFNSNDGKYYYHLANRPSHSTPTTPGPTQDWAYNFDTNEWDEVQINAGGSSPVSVSYGQTMAYDSGKNALIAWGVSGLGGIGSTQNEAEIWIGQFGGSVAPSINSQDPLPSGAQGVPYSVQLMANGTTPFTWSITSGTLPQGLSMSTGGLISGTPVPFGTAAFTVQVSNGTAPNASATFHITINPPLYTVPITVQEALYPGDPTNGGIARTNEPFCLGIPIPDAQAITSTNSLSMAGVSAIQFRQLGTWASGHLQWVEACGIVSSLAAAGTVGVTFTGSGAGNFGGPNLAVDSSPATPNNGTITVNTGAATFTVKKANFNGIDTAVVGSATLLPTSTAATRGLVLLGPDPTQAFPANVTCGTGTGQSPCTHLYSSSNDPSSTCAIEENGPVKAVLACYGTHKDAAGNPYMHFTARETFWKNRSSVKVNTVLRNADYDTHNSPSVDAAGNTFNTAFKGLGSYELRLSPNISGTLSYQIASYSSDPNCASGICAGTLATGVDTAYIEQGITTAMNQNLDAGVCGSSCSGTYTKDQGFSIVKNGVVQSTGTQAQPALGWADIRDASGNGLLIGVYQMAAYYPKSLEFVNGNDVRVGIWPSENGNPTGGPGNGTFALYQAWPAWSIHDTFLEFHAGALPSPQNDFLKFQHYLVARATPSYYNSTAVFPSPIVDAATEDAFYVNLATVSSPAIATANFCFTGTTNCTPDLGITSPTFPLSVYRGYAWDHGGGTQQAEYRDSDMVFRFLQRGQTGRFMNSSHFYRMFMEKGWAHFDGTVAGGADATVNGGKWRTRLTAGQVGDELDTLGLPAPAGVPCRNDPGLISPAPCLRFNNSALAFMSYPDLLHMHWYGLPDYYFLTGDETVHESLEMMKDFFLNPNTIQEGCQLNGCSSTQPPVVPAGLNCGQLGGCYTRAFGINLMGADALGRFLNSTGDTLNGAAVLAAGAKVYSTFVKPDICVNGFPLGCSAPPISYPTITYPLDPSGISRVRGVPLAGSGRIQGFCPSDGNSSISYRGTSTFQNAILVKGLLRLRNSLGQAASANWTNTDYDFATDLAYGMTQWAKSELYNDDGTSNWQSATGNGLFNGYKFELYTDFANVCPPATPSPTTGFVTTNGTAVTWASGLQFTTGSLWANQSILINGTHYGVQSVTDSQHLTLNALDFNPGVNSTPVPYVITGIFVGASGASPSFYPVFPNGFANIQSDGKTVNWVSGQQFTTDGSWNGLKFTLNANNCGYVDHVVSASQLILSIANRCGANLSNKGYSINPTIYEVVNAGIDQKFDSSTLGQPCQSCWPNFHGETAELAGTPSWQRQAVAQLQQIGDHKQGWPSDFGADEIQQIIYDLNNPSQNSLQDLGFSFSDQGSGNYQVTYTCPLGCQFLRIKWSPLLIAPSTALLGFDPLITNTFTLDPHLYMTWFGANPVNEPDPTPGVSQSFTIATGVTGLVAGNFSVKYMGPPATFSIVTGSPLPNGAVGVAYSQAIQTSNGTGNVTACAVIAGNLPAWASLAPSGTTCVMSGTPNLIGVNSFTVQATDSASATASQAYQLTITSSCAITTASPLGSGTVGTAFWQTIATSGCLAPVSWTVGAGVDAGLTIGSSSGTLSGTPVGPAGTDTFTITATDASGASPQVIFNQTIIGATCNLPVITSTSPLPADTVGVPYSFQFAATGDTPISWIATGGMPPGLSMNSSGHLLGVPTVAGTGTLQVTAINSCGQQVGAPTAFSISISSGASGIVKRGHACRNCAMVGSPH